MTGNQVSCREDERYVAVSQSVRDRESGFTSQVEIHDRTVQVNACDHLECVSHGRRRPDDFGSFGSKFLSESYGEDVVVLYDQDAFAGEVARHFCRSASQPTG
jgi:hypothetical protein